MKKREGITLIALVITIIVLLILAGLTISLALGQNGIFKRALQAKQETRISEVKEEVQKWILNNEINEKLGYKESIVSTEDFLKGLKDKGKITEDEYNKAMQGAKSDNPKITINNGKEDVEIPLKRQDGTGSGNSGEQGKTDPNPNPPKIGDVVPGNKIKIGSVIKYNPKRDVTDTNLLKYTSPKGNTSDTTYAGGGNGHSDQTFTVEDKMNEWLVYKNVNGKLTIVAKEPTSQKMTLRGGQGWLYAERELNKACSIYGYGKGADKSHVTTYAVGSTIVPGELKNETITGSGARSLGYQEILDLAGIDEAYKKEKDDLYGNTYLRDTVKIPTIKSSSSTKASAKTYKSQVISTLFNSIPYDESHSDKFRPIWKEKEHWLSGRGTLGSAVIGFFEVYKVRPFKTKYSEYTTGIIGGEFMFQGIDQGDVEEKDAKHSLLPVCHLVKDIEFVLAEKRDGVDVYSIK